MDNQNEIEIDLLDLFHHLKTKFWIILIAVILCGAIGAMFTMNVMEDQYTTETRMYVLNQSSSSAAGAGALAYSDFQVADQLLEDYLILMTGRNVVDEVIETLNLNITRDEFNGKVKAKSLNNTRVFQIEVTDTDPQRAADIANCVRDVASRQITEIMNVGAVNLVYEAEVPQKKSGPSMAKNTVLAAAIGAIIAISILTAVYIMDDTIRNEEDVARYLGLSVMGVIPASEELAKMSKMTGKVKKATKQPAKSK